jgi:hypothetical protein
MGIETWTYAYTSTEDAHIGEVYKNLQNILENVLTLSPQTTASVKIAATDVSSRAAHGIAFYSSSFPQPPDRPTGNWQFKEWHNKGEKDHDDPTKLYTKVRDALNGHVIEGLNVKLSASQAYYSLVCMSDHKTEKPTMALYWLG